MAQDTTKHDTDEDPTGALQLSEFTDIFREMEEQPAWRTRADKEMDYVDGNQLSSEVIQRQRAIGMAPAIEPLVGPAIQSVCGLEAKSRADWRVMPDTNDDSGDEVAKALNFKLNQAERKSRADQACSDAYRSQISVGIGWVEVSRNPNPFQYPYRCRAIHRNEIWWDMKAKEADLADARWLVRRVWTASNQAKLMFPGQKRLIAQAASGWSGMTNDLGTLDGGQDTDLNNAWVEERSWTVEQQEWRDTTQKRVCLFEVWYRRWHRLMVLKTPDGRVVEFDKANPVHKQLVALKVVTPEWAVVPKMRRSYWLGPHRLADEPTPYRHQKFPYVPFWGFLEDRTRTPYGLVRGMVFSQDSINAMNAKLMWGLGAVRTTRTKGAYAGTDQQFRQEIARRDADIILDADEMARPGAMFQVERDFQLNTQQFQMLQDARNAIARVSNITPSLKGEAGGATSGIQEATQVEQSTQGLADLNDNAAFGRAEVGDLLLSLIVEDTIGQEESVTITGNPLRQDETVRLNVPTTDEDGTEFLTNDVERTKLKVALNDVPSTPSYRSHQLMAMSEAFKASPPDLQARLTPYLLALMDLPAEMREDIISDVRAAAGSQSPEDMEAMIQQRIQAAVEEARIKDMRDLKMAELERRYPVDLIEAQVRKVVADTFKTNGDALYAANQTAAVIATNPAIAPMADVIAQAAGYQPPNPGGVDPNMPVPEMTAPVEDVAGVPGVVVNTSPTSPPVPQEPSGSMTGIETQSTTDNLPQ
ncbi:MAG TPA: hypothetical protein VN156_11980 [Pseudomonas sp.]|nr:hypothetical protein [Pseudomonas sp.]